LPRDRSSVSGSSIDGVFLALFHVKFHKANEQLGAVVKTRHSIFSTVLIVLLGAVTLQASLAQVQSAPLKKVRIAMGGRVVGITHPWLTLPQPLSYWKDEGLDVEVQPFGGSLESIQQLVGGNVEFAQVNSAPLVQASANNGLALRSVMLNTVNDWSVVALEDGPIKTMKDFKGKEIGVPALSSGGVPLLKELLQANGLVPDKDVAIVPVGFGAPAYDAIRSNRVQGLIFFQSAFTSFENLGAKFRYFSGKDWRKQPDFTLVTTPKIIDQDPNMVQSLVRGAAKGVVFSFANPDCTRRILWKTWPNVKPTGAPDETLIKWDLNNLAAQQKGMMQAYQLSGGKLWGAATPEEYGALQDFLLRAGLIKQKVANESLIVGIPNFFEEVNKFDREAVARQANDCARF
jgi:NitT/TauT family transport system substrate-binding protein